jgi:hypothetical protein
MCTNYRGTITLLLTPSNHTFVTAHWPEFPLMIDGQLPLAEQGQHGTYVF